MKLDLGSGPNPAPGFEGVDKYCEVQHRLDLFSFPWPFPDSSAEEVVCSHFFEHVPANLRYLFMDEVYRILKPGCRATFTTPHWATERAIQDATHEWPPIAHSSYVYFDKGWRQANNLDHPPYPSCDFEISPPGYVYNEEYRQRAFDFVQQAQKNWINVVYNLNVTLISRKRG